MVIYGVRATLRGTTQNRIRYVLSEISNISHKQQLELTLASLLANCCLVFSNSAVIFTNFSCSSFFSPSTRRRSAPSSPACRDSRATYVIRTPFDNSGAITDNDIFENTLKMFPLCNNARRLSMYSLIYKTKLFTGKYFPFSYSNRAAVSFITNLFILQ